MPGADVFPQGGNESRDGMGAAPFQGAENGHQNPLGQRVLDLPLDLAYECQAQRVMLTGSHHQYAVAGMARLDARLLFLPGFLSGLGRGFEVRGNHAGRGGGRGRGRFQAPGDF